MASFSLDRLTILGDMNEELDNLIRYLEYGLLLNRTKSSYPYEYSYKIPGKGFVQIAREDAFVPKIRFEFNPKHSVNDSEVRKMYRNIISYLKNVIFRYTVKFEKLFFLKKNDFLKEKSKYFPS